MWGEGAAWGCPAATSALTPPPLALSQAVSNMRATFGSRETQGKLESDARKELSARVVRETDESARGQSAYTRANADFVKDQGGAQATIRREQDVVLDKMSSGLDTLKEMSLAIDAELKDQEKMIEDVDSGVDEAQGKMDGALKSIEKILKTKDKCQLATIFCLVVIFVIGACAEEGRAPSRRGCRTDFCSPVPSPPPPSVTAVAVS